MNKAEYVRNLKNKYSESVAYIDNAIGSDFACSIVIGSGIAGAIGSLTITEEIPYDRIPEFPRSSVAGHSNKLLTAEYAGKRILVFSGRFHLYEGFGIDEILSPVLISHRLGMPEIILTNAGGALNSEYKPGDIMLISDTLNFTARRLTADIEFSEGLLGDNFSKERRSQISERLTEKGIFFREGTYLAVTGPNYETPAEIRYYRKTGADTIGMSTVLEALAARMLGMSTVGCTLVTNVLHETETLEISHDHVVATGRRSETALAGFVESAVETL